MWKSLYDSAWHNPGIFALAAFFLLIWLIVWPKHAPSLRHLRVLVAGLAVVVLADIALTGGLSPLAPAHRHWIGYVAIPFVILGDARVFLLFEQELARSTVQDPARSLKTYGRALAMALIVPVLQAILLQLFPSMFAQRRRLFLAYELMFLPVLLGYIRVRVQPALVARAQRLTQHTWLQGGKWLSLLGVFVFAQYALWALADVMILAGLDAGYLVRFVPNAMYYALFLPFAYGSAPSDRATDET
ncbi:MAG: hypothetical protein Q8Q09_27195 [Deltaproteobacteria bacterium]|nr:hypothetical protein [Deltaproteobacteria bacterium]